MQTFRLLRASTVSGHPNFVAARALLQPAPPNPAAARVNLTELRVYGRARGSNVTDLTVAEYVNHSAVYPAVGDHAGEGW